MKKQEIQSASLKDLVKRVEEINRDVVNYKMNKEVNPEKDINKVGKLRKELARIKTQVKKLEIEGANRK